MTKILRQHDVISENGYPKKVISSFQELM